MKIIHALDRYKSCKRCGTLRHRVSMIRDEVTYVAFTGRGCDAPDRVRAMKIQQEQVGGVAIHCRPVAVPRLSYVPASRERRRKSLVVTLKASLMLDLNHSRNLTVRSRAGSFQVLFLLPVLTAGFGLMLAGQMTAQTLTTLHSFSATTSSYPWTNSDGATPQAGLILSSNTLYGTAAEGGGSGNGTVFKVNTDGTGFTVLHSFTALILYSSNTYGAFSSEIYTNNDGALPMAGLVLWGNTLYGTASQGGSSGNGTVFAINTDGTGFTTLHSFTPFGFAGISNFGNLFTNSDGISPNGGLILSGDTLYGTAVSGGSSSGGTVFKIKTDGAGFATLHSFTGVTDGSQPWAGLILSGGVLYGTTFNGGIENVGTVFAINTDGTGFTTLHNFIDSEGSYLQAGLGLSGNTLFGTAPAGGYSSPAGGTVFAINTDGTGFKNLYSFTDQGSNGSYPLAGLISSGSTLYGTAFHGGIENAGTVFVLNTDGTGFAILHSFTLGGALFPTNNDGGWPVGGLVSSTNTLYGTTSGNSLGLEFPSMGGTVFSLSFAPQLALTRLGANIILTWPTNTAGFDYTGYNLQSTTNLTFPVWTTNSLAPVVVNRQSTVTNPISGKQQFFRLSQ